MTAHSSKLKLKLLNKVLKNKISVTQACRTANISRKSFYSWKNKLKDSQKISLKELRPKYKKAKNHYKSLSSHTKKEIQKAAVLYPELSIRGLKSYLQQKNILVSSSAIGNFLKKNQLNKGRRQSLKNNFSSKLRLDPKVRLLISARAEQKIEKVTELAKNYQVSRKTIYKWLKRMKGAVSGQELKMMKDRTVKGEEHYRAISSEIREKILRLVRKDPSLSTHKIASLIKEVSNHGVQNFLQKQNLNTYEKRLSYVQQMPAKGPAIQVYDFVDQLKEILGNIPKFAAIPPPGRLPVFKGFLPDFFKFFLGGFLTSIIFFNLFLSWLRMLNQAPDASSKIGLVLASLALLSGSLFFIYSLKYYLTLLMVLSFSRRSGNPSHFEDKAEKSRWLSAVFGQSSNSRKSLGYVSGGGLQASLEHIVLPRKPFVSIQVPLYNEKRVAERLLKACTNIKYSNSHGEPQYEVIICDDSTDETTEIVENFAQQWNGGQKTEDGKQKKVNENGKGNAEKEERLRPVVKILHRNNREGFKGAALGNALKQMDPRTEFVVVFDADFVPYPDTLELFVKYFMANGLDISNKVRVTKPVLLRGDGYGNQQSQDLTQLPSQNRLPNLNPTTDLVTNDCKIAAIGGYQWHVLNKSENWITRGVRSEYAGSYVIERPGQELMGLMKLISGSVYMIRADILKAIGWGTSITEDLQLTLRLYDQGYKVIYTPYVQGPAECVSTLKRLIRQRMRWAEGHSFNVKRMFKRLLFGRWTDVINSKDNGKFEIPNSKLQKNPNLQFLNDNIQYSSYQQSAINNQQLLNKQEKVWLKSPLTIPEKIEFLFLTPYYLQAFFFLTGTFCWLISEAVFKAQLPFWTTLWGWSLVLTNFFALPLVNSVGLFLEESEEKDYLGIISFVILSYILVPFQAYASLKGFLEKEEGPWFRTPKTGMVTDIFKRGQFYRWISSILPGLRAGGIATSLKNYLPAPALAANPYLSLATANNRFNSFRIPRRRLKWLSKTVLAVILIITVTLLNLTQGVPEVLATPPATTQYLSATTTTTLTNSRKFVTSAGVQENATSLGFVRNAIGSYKYYPGTGRTSLGTGETKCGTPNGYGYILDTPFGNSGAIASGSWTFNIYVSDNNSSIVGHLDVCVYKITVSGGSIAGSTLLFESEGNAGWANTDIWNNTAASYTETATSIAAKTLTTNEYLYIEYWNTITTKNNALATTYLYTGDCGATDPSVVIPTITIPENLYILVASTPIIILAIFWLREKKKTNG